MAITHTTGEDFSAGGGNYLKQEGWYHLFVAEATDTPTNKDNVPIANAIFGVGCTVMEGTSPECRDKMVDLTFFHPKNDGSKGSEIDQKKIDRAFLAMNLVDPTDQQKQVSIEASDMVGQQFIAHLTCREGSTFLQLHYADIFHVDDPEVAQQPKNEQTLALIKPQHRKVGNQPAAPKPAAAPAAAPAAPASAASAPAPAAVSSGYDDI